ncbi:MAG: hypothetical protein KGJ59_06655 [Bacteroidota bacterium]|nr:hypothetical protein [Bacteroidota bacterium]
MLNLCMRVTSQHTFFQINVKKTNTKSKDGMAAILIGWLAVYYSLKKAQKVKEW